MYLHEGEEALASLEKPLVRICNDIVQFFAMCGRYVTWADYLNRTENPNNPISKSLAAPGRKAVRFGLGFQ